MSISIHQKENSYQNFKLKKKKNSTYDEGFLKKYYSQASANMISYNMISHNMMFQFGSKKFL